MKNSLNVDRYLMNLILVRFEEKKEIFNIPLIKILVQVNLIKDLLNKLIRILKIQLEVQPLKLLQIKKLSMNF